jgi:hypothetical protein
MTGARSARFAHAGTEISAYTSRSTQTITRARIPSWPGDDSAPDERPKIRLQSICHAVDREATRLRTYGNDGSERGRLPATSRHLTGGVQILVVYAAPPDTFTFVKVAATRATSGRVSTSCRPNSANCGLRS